MFFQDLNKEYNVNLSKNNILSSERIRKIETKNICYTNKNTEEAALSNMSKKDVIYFYMLDRNKQIQILKQYKKQLFLLEENEIEEPLNELNNVKVKK